jgi:uncharacterized membrane protein YtjA (UPF0391 family)
MLYWALVFLLIAIIASILGYGQLAAGAETIAIALFWVFLIVFLATLIVALVRRSRK